jgi:hypothetical protein
VFLVRTKVSAECITSIIKVTRIGELGTTLAATSNRSMLWLVVTTNVVLSSPILVTLMMEVIRSSVTSVLKEPHGVTSQKMVFFHNEIVRTLPLTPI